MREVRFEAPSPLVHVHSLPGMWQEPRFKGFNMHPADDIPVCKLPLPPPVFTLLFVFFVSCLGVLLGLLQPSSLVCPELMFCGCSQESSTLI